MGGQSRPQSGLEGAQGRTVQGGGGGGGGDQAFAACGPPASACAHRTPCQPPQQLRGWLAATLRLVLHPHGRSSRTRCSPVRSVVRMVWLSSCRWRQGLRETRTQVAGMSQVAAKPASGSVRSRHPPHCRDGRRGTCTEQELPRPLPQTPAWPGGPVNPGLGSLSFLARPACGARANVAAASVNRPTTLCDRQPPSNRARMLSLSSAHAACMLLGRRSREGKLAVPPVGTPHEAAKRARRRADCDKSALLLLLQACPETPPLFQRLSYSLGAAWAQLGSREPPPGPS